MSINSHIDHLCKGLYFQIKKLSTVRKFLNVDVTKKLVCSYILSKLDYCNSLFIGASIERINKLQRLQNNAAEMTMMRKKSDSSHEILKELHWLPIRERIIYKVGMLCYKCLYDGAPLYLKKSITLYNPVRPLRSSSENLLIKPKKNLKRYGERSFDYFGPAVWNDLPKEIRHSDSLSIFKKHLKYFLFTKTYETV